MSTKNNLITLVVLLAVLLGLYYMFGDSPLIQRPSNFFPEVESTPAGGETVEGETTAPELASSTDSGVPSTFDLNGSTFRLASFEGELLDADTVYTLSFEGSKLGAKFCNGMGGDYILGNGMIQADLVGTLMFCSEPANLMEIESTFSSLMSSGAQFVLGDNSLTLIGPQGEQMIFELHMD